MPFSEALDAARWMGEHDVLDFQPRIRIATGQVTVGFVGTPLRYNCSVFGRPVALAPVPPEPNAPHHSTRIAFPSSCWQGRDFAKQFYPRRTACPDGSVQDEPVLWELGQPRQVELKNVGPIEVIEIVNPMVRLNTFSTEDRAKEGVAALQRAGRYWPR